MPELPEVETVRKILDKSISNLQIESVSVNYQRLIRNDSVSSFEKKLKGQTIKSISRNAKYLLFNLSDYDLISHLRMEGKYYYIESDEDMDKVHGTKHILMTIVFTNGKKLLYHDVRKFGTIDIFEKDKVYKNGFFNKVGPEPWDTDIDSLFNSINKSSRPIKNILLDQSIMSGLGNIYVDEVLLWAKINPLRKGTDITHKDAEEIRKYSIEILKKAISMNGTTIRTYTASLGVKGSYQDIRVAYGRKGEECFRCKDIIEKTSLSGRGTHFCPTCQKK